MRMYRVAVWTVGACLAILLLALVYTLGYVSNDGGNISAQENSNSNSGSSSNVDFGTLNQIVGLLERDYFSRDQLDEEGLYQAAIKGMLDSLSDTGTYYIDPTTLLRESPTSGSFEGIGATVSLRNSQITIIQPYPDSPAEAAGIKAGDVVVSVDGKSTQGWSTDEAVLKIRGPKGTTVKLSVKHLDGSTEDLTITRDEVEVNSVTTSPPGGVLHDSTGADVTDLAYIRISEFTQRTPDEVQNALKDVESSGKAGLIIDLRVNPGGLLQETVDISDMFLDSGVILVEQDRDGNESSYRAKTGGPATRIPIVVLADEFSASGAEVLAAALHDNGRATVIGETTYGKGTVNISQPLDDGGLLRVTIRHWLTPAGVQIDEVGITPDIYVVPGPLDPTYDPDNDRQLAAAIAKLHGQPVTSDPTPVPTTTAAP
jgi:carboxyl-terminal processing protease